MFLHLTKAKYIRDFIIEVAFNDGRSGLADLSIALKGSVFGELKDVDKFSKFELDEEFKTIVWQNGADLAPEFIYNTTLILTKILNLGFTLPRRGFGGLRR
jgi:hypothetical protein